MDILKRNNVTVLGQGSRVLMLAHGFGCDQSVWRHLVAAFRDDWKVVLFDYVGSGRSDPRAYDPQRYAGLAGYAQDVIDICQALDLRDVAFVGHSVSGMIGALAAIAAPERFGRLLMLGPSPCYINDEGYVGGFERDDLAGLLEMMEHNYYGWAAFLAPLATGDEERGGLSDEVETAFCRMDPYVARRFAAATFLTDNRPDLPKVSTPTLLMMCSDDAIVPPAVGDYMAAAMPCARLLRMQATGHFPHLSHPDETIAGIRDYLAAADTARVPVTH